MMELAGHANPRELPMHHDGDGFWSVRLEGIEPGATIEYRYAFEGLDGERRREPVFRRLEVAGHDPVVWDHWLAPELPDGAFLRQAFAGVIFNPARTAVVTPPTS